MITHDDYAFAERDGIDDRWVVHLLTGDYKDTYVIFGSVKLIPPEGGTVNDEDAVMKFQYDIVDHPHYLNKEDLEVDVDFMDHIGDILRHIITSAFERGDYKIGDRDGQSGDDDSEESSSQ